MHVPGLRHARGGIYKCKHFQAGILQHDGAARDAEKSHIADALRNRERLQPSEYKRLAFLSSDDEEVFTAYCRENGLQQLPKREFEHMAIEDAVQYSALFCASLEIP
ncbi:Hypp4046 [Branchiostoma lanceolatum]|uniref:Hypp4046 protein n=1 Tax=Branchiostoma lanceolatum TaxID=7740 RepID=A0A8K0EZJ8_BRALA|nr:Hypp4046 [Branchiostoma lanceolatum]